MNKQEILEQLHESQKKLSLSSLRSILEFTTHQDIEIKRISIATVVTIVKNALFESYHDIQHGVREKMITLLSKMDIDILPVIEKEIRSVDIYKRIRAIQLLGFFGKKQCVEKHLTAMIRDNDEKVRATVIMSIGKLIDRSEANMLLALLNDFDDRVRANTIEALGKLGSKSLIGILLRYKNDANNRIRANTLKALWNLGYKDIIGSLSSMIKSTDENMRASGAWLISELVESDSSFNDYIMDIKFYDSQIVKDNVIRALLKTNPSFSRKYLKSIFQESEIQEVKEMYNL